MKTFRVPLALLLLTAAVYAQDAEPANPVPTAPASVTRTPQELDQLLGPIALYPDALIALILPASTVPTDIVLAARHLRDNPGDRAQIEHRAWDESVKSLTNYPEVVKWMDENLHWTRQVGEAFAVQPADVMQSIQRLRAKARAAGTLSDTPQQQVIAEPQVIRIVPAQPDVIYVPHYEPEIVFVDRPVYYTRPFLTFGIGVPVGSWLAFDCDWRRNSIWVGNRHRRWTGHDWRRPVVPFAPGYAYTRTPEVRQWRPPLHVVRPAPTVGNRFRSEVARPAPFGFASSRTHTYHDSNSTARRSGFNPPPVVPALPRHSSSGFRNDSVGPRASTPVVAPPLPTARVITAPASGPNVQPPSQVRRSGNDGIREHNRPRSDATRDYTNRPSTDNSRNFGNRSTNGDVRDYSSRPTADGTRDYGNHSRSFRNQAQSNVTTAPLPVVPALPMASPPRTVQPMGPTSHRSYSRPASAPATIPALPMQSRASAPAPMGPVAPQVAPQSAPTAPAQAAPVQRSGGESRGHRGSYSGRRNSS